MKTYLYQTRIQNLFGGGQPNSDFTCTPKRTDVDYMPIGIDHDIPIMSIFDLQDITSNRVCGHRLNEVETSLLERYRIDSTILVDEVGIKVIDFGTSHFVSRSSIRYDVDDTALRI